MEEKPKYRISLSSNVLWIFFAGIADLLSLIPFVGTATGPIFWICASIYLWKAGCGFVNGKQLATKLLSVAGEILPAVQELPLTLAGMIIVLIMIRAEDKTGVPLSSMANKGKKPGLNSGGVRTPTQITEPLYKDGVRSPRGGLK